MTLGIIAAMKSEIKGLQALMDEPKCEVISGVTFVCGKIEGCDVVTAVSGVGKVLAAICAQTMLLKYKPSAVINIGVAGSLTPKLGVMDTAFANKVCQHDMDTSALGDPKGFISGVDEVYIPTDIELTHKLRTSALRLAVPCRTGVIASGDRFISDFNEKKRIRKAFNAVAVEMEGASIGLVCHINSVPFAVVRTISDGAGAAADYNVFALAAARNSISIILEFLRELRKEQLC